MLTSTAETGSRTRYNPIDHIFQFHKALKRDLTALEESAQRFNAAVHDHGSVPEAAPVSLHCKLNSTEPASHHTRESHRAEQLGSAY